MAQGDLEVLARRIQLAREALRAYFQEQAALYAEYIEQFPPPGVTKRAWARLRKADANAAWIESVVVRREWWNQGTRSFEYDEKTLTAILQEQLEEAAGEAGAATAKTTGGAGWKKLDAAATKRLMKQYKALKDGTTEERQFYEALWERTMGGGSTAILKDGAGRSVAAVTWNTSGDALNIIGFGALEGEAPGATVQALREIAGEAAAQGKRLTIFAGMETQALTDAGFVSTGGGWFDLDATKTAALAKCVPATGPAWMQQGFMEGGKGVKVIMDYTRRASDLMDELAADWQYGQTNYAMAQGAVGNRQGIEDGWFSAGEVQRRKLAILRGPDGKLEALCGYTLPDPRAGDNDLYVDYLASRQKLPGAGRTIMRHVASVAAEHNAGIDLYALEGAYGFYERIGMSKSMESYSHYGFTAAEAKAFASGLTGSVGQAAAAGVPGAAKVTAVLVNFSGQVSWELAVAGAHEYLMGHQIKRVVDEVSAATHNYLKTTLAAGLESGESITELSRRVQGAGWMFDDVRGERIARTECLTANRSGNHSLNRDAGAEEKTWRSNSGHRTRKWHREANGRTVPVDEPFIVKNGKGKEEKLMFPGDSSMGASADNVINCRCTVLYKKAELTAETAGKRDQHGMAGERASGPIRAGGSGT